MRDINTSENYMKTNNVSYKEMIDIVKNHEVWDFFPSYSGLTRTTYEAEVSEPFIREIFKEFEPDLMSASTHKFGASAEAPKGDKVTYFRTKALEWALDEFRMYAGQWNRVVYENLDWYNTDLYRENYRREVGFLLDILRNEVSGNRNKIIAFFRKKAYRYSKNECVSIYYHILNSISTNDIAKCNAKWVG